MNEDNVDSRDSVDESSNRGRSSRLLAWLAPGFLQRRYAAKFVVSLLVIIVVIGAVGAIGYAETRDTVSHDTADQLRSTTTLQADSLSEWDRHMRGQTRTLSDAEALESDDAESVRPFLQSYVEDVDDVKAIHYVDTANGSVVASSAESLEGEPLDDLSSPWSTTDIAATDGIWMANGSYRSKVLHEHLVTAYAAAVPGEDRAIVVVGGLFHRLEGLHQPTTNQTTWIVDTSGETVLSSNNVRDAPPGETVERVTELQADDGEGYVGNGHHGDSPSLFDEQGQYLVAYAPVEGTDWVAVTAVEKESAYAVRDDVERSLLSVVGAGLLSLVVVGTVLGRQTVTPLADLRRKAERMDDGDLDVDLRTHREDEIGRLYESFDSMRDSLRDRLDRVTDARQSAEESLAMTERMNDHLEGKASEYGAVMRACAAGDLTRRMEPDEESEAMAEIAREFNEMMTELEHTTERLNRFATEVAAASEQVTERTVEVSQASHQVSDSIQTISEGAEHQDELLQSVTGEIGDLAKTIERIAQTSDAVAKIAKQTALTGQDGREATQEAVVGMRQIEDENAETVAEIERLEAEMDRIDELTESITEIAEQTNMLALNANIEASRGDADSEGFAVVAEEVKDLATETKEAAEDIEARIEGIKEQTRRATREVNETSEQIAAHADTVENAADALDEIANYARQTNEGVQRISDATDEQAESIRQVADHADDAAGVSRRTSEEAGNVTAAAEEQTTALAEVSESATGLARQATRLSDALDDFETDAGVSIEPVDALATEELPPSDAADVRIDDD